MMDSSQLHIKHLMFGLYVFFNQEIESNGVNFICYLNTELYISLQGKTSDALAV